MYSIAVLVHDRSTNQLPSSPVYAVAVSNKDIFINPRGLFVSSIVIITKSSSNFLIRTSFSILSTPRMFSISPFSNLTFRLLRLCKSTLLKYTAIIFNTHRETPFPDKGSNLLLSFTTKFLSFLFCSSFTYSYSFHFVFDKQSAK